VYACDGIDTTEVTDSNEVYGGGEEENEDQILDINPNYE